MDDALQLAYCVNCTLPTLEHGEMEGVRELIADGLITVKQLMTITGIESGISLIELYDSAIWIRAEPDGPIELYPIGEDGVALFHPSMAIRDPDDICNRDQWWKHYALYGPAQDITLIVYTDHALTLPEDFDSPEFLARKMDV